MTKTHAKITTLGSSDAFNSGGRGNSCFYVEDDLGAYTVDFGPTAPLIAQKIGVDLNQIEVLYLTHLHGDHIGGIPSLLIELIFMSRRTRPLTIAGPIGSKAVLHYLCDLLYPKTIFQHLTFELNFVEWPLHGEVIVADRRIIARPAQHDPQVAPTSIRIEPIKHQAPVLAFSGDTGWCDSLIEIAQQADALICECSFAEYLFEGHLSLEEIKKFRQKLEVNHLILTHFSEASREAAIKERDTLHLKIADDGVVFIIHSHTVEHP